MRRLISKLIIALGASLVDLGRKLDKPTPPASRAVIRLSRRNYRVRNRQPGRAEVIRLGLSILLNSVAWATLGA